MIARPDLAALPELHRVYAARVPDGDVLAVLRAQGEEVAGVFGGLSDERLDRAYAPGKWTPRQLLGHLLDGEWVFSYRAVRFSRGDGERLAAMDEDAMMAGSTYATRSVESLLDEYRHLRAATVAMYGALSEEQLARVGHASSFALSPAALAYCTAGHEAHHLEVLRERYL